MRIFVTGTGRCGTATFYHACKHITNYTCGHETAARHIGVFDYPDNHIEVDAHLQWFVGALIKKYPDAKWVHLIRERESCVKSIASQGQKILEPLQRIWCQNHGPFDAEVMAGLFYDVCNANINEHLWLTNSIRVVIDDSIRRWDRFWQWIKAEGGYDASLNEFNRKYNPSEKRGRDNWV